MAEVLCIGETMALVVPASAEPIEAAEQFHVDAGGAESNVASHLAAAGHNTAWLGAVGDDALGIRVRDRVLRSGVDVSQVTLDPAAPTGLYVKDPGRGVSYYRRGSAASRLGPAAIADVNWTSLLLLHLSGISLALSDSNRQLVFAAIAAARQHGVHVSFDVNYRPALWDSCDAAAGVLHEAASAADIVFVGRDEAETVWHAAEAAQIRDLVFSSTPHLVVKDADVEAREFSDAGETVVPARPVDVVEPVGAGDAFAAGWLHAFLRGGDAAARLACGHEFASRVLVSTRDVPVSS